MALGSTQPITEMSTRNLPGNKERPARKAETSPTFLSRLSRKCVTLDISQPYGPLRPVTGITLLLSFTLHSMNAYREVEVQLQTFNNTVLERGHFITCALWVVAWNGPTVGRNIVMKGFIHSPGTQSRVSSPQSVASLTDVCFHGLLHCHRITKHRI
jgi:hypothetical protein